MFGISYDPVAVLGEFAGKHGITFTLFADEGSKVIREIGMLNEHIAIQQAQYGVGLAPRHEGTPYPSTFVLDENGIVIKKSFEQSYRVRPTPATFLEESFGVTRREGETVVKFENQELRVEILIAEAAYRPYEKLRLHVDVQPADGLHVYGLPVPSGYTPLAIWIDPVESMEVEPIALPVPHPFSVAGLNESFFVYEGRVAGTLPFHIDTDLGDITLTVRIAYQACSDVVCFAPNELVLQLPLKSLGLIRD